jgi:uncharacterized protein YjbJ (UPF0337 family)
VIGGTMNKNILKGKWEELKGKIKQQWGKLTDDDVTMIEGNYEELEGKLKQRYGYQNDEAKNQIDNFLKDSDSKND